MVNVTAPSACSDEPVRRACSLVDSVRNGTESAPAIVREPSNFMRAVVWDLDDTLVSTTKNVAECRIAACRAMVGYAQTINDDVVRQALEREHLFDAGAFDKVYDLLEEVARKNGGNYDRHYDIVWEILGIPSGLSLASYELHKSIVGAGVAAYHQRKDEVWKPNLEVIAVIKHLKSLGITSAILTKADRADKQKEKIARAGLLDLFDPALIAIVRPMFDSASGKYMNIVDKSAALNQLSRRLDIVRESLYCVGDRVTDTEAAVSAGAQAVYFLNPDGKYPKNERIASPLHVPHVIITQLPQVREIAQKYGASRLAG